MGNTQSGRISHDNVQISQTLWSKACEVTPTQEQAHIKDILGNDVVDENEALFEELATLLDILEGYSEATCIISRKRDEARRKLVGQQKLQLEDQIRGMLEKVNSFNGLTSASSRVAASLTSSLHSHATSNSSGSLNTTISSQSHILRDLSEYRPFLSAKSIEAMAQLDTVADEMRGMLAEETFRLTADIEWVRAEINQEMDRRHRVVHREDSSVTDLMSLKQELEVTGDRDHWSNRLRRADSSRRRTLDDADSFDPLQLKAVGSGGLAGVFAAAAARGMVSPSSKDGDGRFNAEAGDGDGGSGSGSGSGPIPEEQRAEAARDWLALTTALGDEGDDETGVAICVCHMICPLFFGIRC